MSRGRVLLVAALLVAAPQTLKVPFSYFGGRVNWRPVLISRLRLRSGNDTPKGQPA